MARLWYGGTGAELIVTPDATNGGALIPDVGRQLTVWDARTGGNQVPDLLDVTGAGISVVVTNGIGRILPFQAPEGYVNDLWLDPGSGDRYRCPPSMEQSWALIARVDITGATDGQTITWNAGAAKFVPAAAFRATATGVGFFGTSAQSKPTITGSRGGNAALASLLTALADLGLIVNSTS
jgi:hypothetical protein